MAEQPPLVVFTDLDGTLLDHDDYSFDAAREALELLRQRGIAWLMNKDRQDLAGRLTIALSPSSAVPKNWRHKESHRAGAFIRS